MIDLKELRDDLDRLAATDFRAIFDIALVEEAATKYLNLQGLIDEQAEDEELWFVATTAPEAYLQQELRRLHVALEGT